MTEEEMRQILADLLGEVEAKHEKKVADLVARLDAFETKANREGLPGGEMAPDGGPVYKGKRAAWEIKASEDLRAMALGTYSRKDTAFGQTGDDLLGGYVCPTILGDALMAAAVTVDPFRSIARVVTVSSGTFAQPLTTSLVGAQWRAEGVDRDNTSVPNMALVTPKFGALSAFPSVTNELLTDSKYPLAGFLASDAGRSMGYTEGLACVSGTGVGGQPLGFLTHENAQDADTWGVIGWMASGTADSFDVDALVNLYYSLTPPYRANAAFVANGKSLALIRTMRDFTGRLVWEPSLAAGQPQRLLGVPIYESPSMPDAAAGTFPVAVADWTQAYILADVGPITLITDRITRPGWTRFFFERRLGACPLQHRAIKLLKCAAS